MHAHITLTGLYNVLERVRAGALKPDLFMPSPSTVADLDCRKAGEPAEALPLTAADAAMLFRQGRKVERYVAAVLEAAHRMAHAERDGPGYALKQAA